MSGVKLQGIGEKRGRARRTAAICCGVVISVSACTAPGDQETNAALPAEDLPPASSCSASSMLRTSLAGSIDADIDWGPQQMHCENMLRPNSEGARLRFSGQYGEHTVAIILGLDGLTAGESGIELPTNVTVSVEGSGRFFSTPDVQTCWTEISAHEARQDDNRHDIRGALYCVAALGELNSNDFVEISELSFGSIIDWSTQ